MKVKDLPIHDEFIIMKGSNTAFEAAVQVKNTSIGAIIVTNEKEEVLGLIDEFDMVTKVIAEKRNPEKTKLSEIITTPPFITLETNVEEAEEIMNTLDLSILPVTDENKHFKGVVTFFDIMEVSLQEPKEKGFIQKIKRVFG